MKNFKILDCTLRDGGYYTNWDFKPQTVDKYLKAMEELPIDYIEIGYRNLKQSVYKGEFFYTPLETLKKVKSLTSKLIVLIIDEKNLSEDDIKQVIEPCKEYIEMIRIAIDPKRFDFGIKKASIVRKLGYKVAFNVMYLSKWIDDNSFHKKLNGIEKHVDYLYLVDSYGSVYPKEINRVVKKIRLITPVKLGFHGHNNMELALANSIEALSCGVEIIDATILGMGRGAGNLKTELLLTQISKTQKINFNLISNVVSEFHLLKKKYSWGTNLPYIISGFYSIPQKKVMDWLGKNFMSFNSIVQALESSISDKKEIELPKIIFENEYDKVLIIGGGNSIDENIDAIKSFLLKNRNLLIVFSSSRHIKHFLDIPNDKTISFIGNEVDRFNISIKNNPNLKIVFPPSPREFGTYLPKGWESKSFELEENHKLKTSEYTHCSLSMQIALKTKLKTFYVVGFDGYQENSINKNFREVFYENEEIFKNFLNEEIEFISLTPSLYKSFTPDSIYSITNK